ncbi:MAG: hypothetical protein RKP20_03310 [Candidatus Competibacter sp.]|nr:hypothetical protein [Candidatus Competibacter sp.]
MRSQRTEAVLAYLDAVRALPDREAPVYLDKRPQTELYVPVDILVREPKEAGAGGEAGGRPPGGREGWAEDDDGTSGREERGRDQEERWRRVSWAEAWPKLRRAVVLGRPGEGKTLLLQTSARELAAGEAEALREFRTSAEAVTLPVYLRLADVAAHAGAVDPWGAAVAQSAERLLRALAPPAGSRPSGSGDRRSLRSTDPALGPLPSVPGRPGRSSPAGRA